MTGTEDVGEQERFKTELLLDSIAAELTYVSCNGIQVEDKDEIHKMWKGVVRTYANDIATKRGEPRMKVVVDRFGASTMRGLDLDEDRATNDVSRGELFFKAVNALLYGKRSSRSGAIVVNTDKNGTYPYNVLESGVDKDGKPVKDLDKLRENVVGLEVSFLDDSGHGTGTTLKVANGSISVTQRLGDKTFDVLEISRAESGALVKATVETETGSSKTFKVDSKKSFWELKRGLLWSDVYPFPSSASEFLKPKDIPADLVYPGDD